MTIILPFIENGLSNPRRHLYPLKRYLKLFCYLVIPRPWPSAMISKCSFLLFGSAVSIVNNREFAGLSRWITYLVLFELCLSQAKYHINDWIGGQHDHLFLRGKRNLFPKIQPLKTVFTCVLFARILLGITILQIWNGLPGLAIGLAVILLQLLYEGVKRSSLASRGTWCLATASAGYGVRCLVGSLAASGMVLADYATVMSFIWSSCLGALSLLLYWYKEGVHYLEVRGYPRASLKRLKPNVLWAHERYQYSRDLPTGVTAWLFWFLLLSCPLVTEASVHLVGVYTLALPVLGLMAFRSHSNLRVEVWLLVLLTFFTTITATYTSFAQNRDCLSIALAMLVVLTYRVLSDDRLIDLKQ